MEKELKQGLSLSVIARLKDRLATLSDQAAWLRDPKTRPYLLERTRKLLEKMG